MAFSEYLFLSRWFEFKTKRSGHYNLSHYLACFGKKIQRFPKTSDGYSFKMNPRKHDAAVVNLGIADSSQKDIWNRRQTSRQHKRERRQYGYPVGTRLWSTSILHHFRRRSSGNMSGMLAVPRSCFTGPRKIRWPNGRRWSHLRVAEAPAKSTRSSR